LKDWYPVSVGQLPIHEARLICQRSNIWWDAKQKLRYCNGSKPLIVELHLKK
jgi:hypothetical protein